MKAVAPLEGVKSDLKPCGLDRVSPSRFRQKVLTMQTQLMTRKFRKLTGNPAFCRIRACLLAAWRDSSMLCGGKKMRLPAVMSTVLELDRHTPAGCGADHLPRTVNVGGGSGFPDPHDEACVGLKHNNELRAGPGGRGLEGGPAGRRWVLVP